MRNRTVLGLLLFVSLSFMFFSVYALLFAFIVKDEPERSDGKTTQKKTTMEEVRSEEMMYFGSKSQSEAVPNVFDMTMRQVAFSDEENPESLSKPKEVSVEEINALLETPERCMAFPGATLLGTAVAIPEAESFATIASSSPKGQIDGRSGAAAGGDMVMVMRIDDEIDPGTVLAAIRRNLVAFKTPGGIRCLGENVGKESAIVDPNKPKDQSNGPNDMNVQQTGPNSYRISREDLNKATANLNSLATEARIVPDRQEGGFKIFSIKPGGLYQKIGVQNGDIVKSINGIELSSPDKALEAYSRLRNANKLSLDIVRRGKRETLDYSVE
ncbi:MAG TPA: type II secretion system protein GspC [bacterium]|nr:type II secretion system protein GspC [bacterium]